MMILPAIEKITYRYQSVKTDFYPVDYMVYEDAGKYIFKQLTGKLVEVVTLEKKYYYITVLV